MKALTIRQPYAHLIAIGKKRVESRPWPTNYRGPLAIHAGKSRAWLQLGDATKYPGMRFGAVVAVAQLVACLDYQNYPTRWPSEYDWLIDDPFALGPFCWILENAKCLASPITMRGRQGLFEVGEVVTA